MNSSALATSQSDVLSSPGLIGTAAPTSSKALGRLGTLFVFLWKYALGMLLTQSVIGCVMAIGWTYRLMQRSIIKQWWKSSPMRDEPVSFQAFLKAGLRTNHHLTWPNWIVAQNAWAQIRACAEEGAASQLKTALKVALPSLWANLKLGGQAIFNTWVFTLPGCALWLFAWYDGWNNSFNKGYEQAAVGPLTGLLGVALFIAAMLYVPMAQARQASTGSWKAFYQFGLITRLIRRHWLASLGLALLYSLISVPVTILRTLPGYFSHINPALEQVAPARAVEILGAYFFFTAALIFPAYLLLKLAAARIYAKALREAAAKGLITEEQLHETEWETLFRLDLLDVKPEPKSHALVKAVSWLGSRTSRTLATLLILFVWFTFVSQIFITEFLNYHPGVGWLNQPLVQLPMIKYIPSGLQGGS